MDKSGCLRRVVILGAFAWAFDHFVLQPPGFLASPGARQALTGLLYGAVAWGVVTLFADRLRPRSDGRRKGNHDDDTR